MGHTVRREADSVTRLGDSEGRLEDEAIPVRRAPTDTGDGPNRRNRPNAPAGANGDGEGG